MLLNYKSEFLIIVFSCCARLWCFAQVDIPVNKNLNLNLSTQNVITPIKSDSIEYILRNFSILVENSDSSQVLFDFTSDDWKDYSENDSQPKIEPFLSDFKRIDEKYNIGYRNFLTRKYSDPARRRQLKRNFERTLSILQSNSISEVQYNRMEENRENSISFGDNISPEEVQAREAIADNDLVSQQELIQNRAGLAAYYYNKTREYKWYYFPIFDWNREIEKSKLTELFFTNKFTDDRLNPLSSSQLNIDFDNQASLSADILSVYFGPGRIALSTLISTNEDSLTNSKENAIQRLIGGGGNLGFTYQIPVFSVELAKKISGGVLFQPKIGLDIPQLNTTLDTTTFHSELSAQSFINIETGSEALSFFGGFKASYIIGNESYQEQIGTGDFWYRQLSFGITINETFRIVYNNYGGGEFVKQTFPNSTLSLILVAD